MADKRDVMEIVAIIGAAYPNFSPTEHTMQVYYETLKDLPSDELKAATLHCVAENGRKFAPSVGELRGAVCELRGYAANVPSSYQAWQEVLQQIREVGYNQTPNFSHPLIDQAVRAMGWRNLCWSEDAVADRARFIQCYEQFEQRAERENMLLPEVRGYIETHGGYLPSPVDSIKLLAGKLGVK